MIVSYPFKGVLPCAYCKKTQRGLILCQWDNVTKKKRAIKKVQT